MYLRTISRRNSSGAISRYLQLAENEWDGGRGYARARVLKSLGREGSLDRDALARLVQACSALSCDEGLQLGIPYLLDFVWRSVGITRVLHDLLEDRRFALDMERVLFALAVNRVFAPSSKLSACEWVAKEASIPGLPRLTPDRCYRAMDLLLTAEDALLRQVFLSAEHLSNREVDLVLFDTSTYEHAEPEGNPFSPGRRPRTADRRETVVGLAVTQSGIPARIWSFPARITDQEIIRRVKHSLADWKLSWVVWVCDRGCVYEETRKFFLQGGTHYVLAEKLKSDRDYAGSLVSEEHYHEVGEGLEVREVFPLPGSGGRRQIICYDRQEAARARARREQATAGLPAEFAAINKKKGQRRARAEAELLLNPVIGPCLARSPRGLIVDPAQLANEARLDGRFVLTCSDESVPAAELAFSYRKLRKAEANWQALKQVLDLYPLRHRRKERIHAHMLLCFLGLFLVRMTEIRVGQSWQSIRQEFDSMRLLEYRGEEGRLVHRTRTTPGQKAILDALGAEEPPFVFTLELPTENPAA